MPCHPLSFDFHSPHSPTIPLVCTLSPSHPCHAVPSLVQLPPPSLSRCPPHSCTVSLVRTPSPSFTCHPPRSRAIPLIHVEIGDQDWEGDVITYCSNMRPFDVPTRSHNGYVNCDGSNLYKPQYLDLFTLLLFGLSFAIDTSSHF